MPNGTYGGVRGKGAQAKRSRSPTYSIFTHLFFKSLQMLFFRHKNFFQCIIHNAQLLLMHYFFKKVDM